MPYVPVPNVAMLELRQLLDNEEIENTSYWRRSTPWDPASLLNLANLGVDWWTDVLAPYVSNAVTIREGFATDLTTATSGVASYAVGLPQPGLDAAESMSNNVAGCVSIRTALRGRSNRGRNYVAGVPITAVTLNTLSNSYMMGIVAAYDALMASGTLAGYTMVVVSRYSGYTLVGGKKKPTPRPVGLATPVASFSFTDSTVDSLRTRLPNH